MINYMPKMTTNMEHIQLTEGLNTGSPAKRVVVLCSACGTKNVCGLLVIDSVFN